MNCQHLVTAETLDSYVCEDCGAELTLQDDDSHLYETSHGSGVYVDQDTYEQLEAGTLTLDDL